MLLLKLLLVPLLVAGVTLAARRWGPAVGGWLSALPTVAGPALGFYAVEQGPPFAAAAAQTALVGLLAVPLFCLLFVHCARGGGWAAGLAAGWSGFFAGVFLLQGRALGLTMALALLCATSAAAYLAMPSNADIDPPSVSYWRWDLPIRMLAAAALIIVLTASADALGPALAGYLTPFPVGIAVIAAFTQHQRGSVAVVTYFRGYLPSLVSFGVFCAALALVLESLTLLPALLLALAAQLSTQAVTVWLLRRVGT